jgi:hypothetical protein
MFAPPSPNSVQSITVTKVSYFCQEPRHASAASTRLALSLTRETNCDPGRDIAQPDRVALSRAAIAAEPHSYRARSETQSWDMLGVQMSARLAFQWFWSTGPWTNPLGQ